MQIIWHGQSCFEIVAATGKGEHITILVDPLDEEITGIKSPKISADVVLVTNNQYTATDAAKNAQNAFVIDNPGEYEVKGVYIQGVASVPREDKGAKGMRNAIYSIEAEDMHLCHLGNLQQAELSEEQVSKIGNIDILMCPVGDGDAIDAKEALKVMSQIEPSIAIPMNYQIPKLKMKLGTLAEFLKDAGVGAIEPLSKLTIKKKDISPEEAKIVVLSQ